MSNVNIKRAVENIKTGTTVYTPVVELVVNAIQAVEEGKSSEGFVRVVVKRSPQTEVDIDGALPAVDSIIVEDNGVGFNDANRNAFDTLYTDNKISVGGKGFGRFTCLKYFDSVTIDSTYRTNGAYARRRFEMGKETEIIVNESVSVAVRNETGTVVSLSSVRQAGRLNKKLPTIAKGIVEKLLPYFIDENYVCPTVTLVEADGSDEIVLNNYLKEKNAVITEVPIDGHSFSIDANGQKHSFDVRIFKFFSPRNTKSKISLVAHNREVTETPTQNYVPEFSDEFYEKRSDGSADEGRNYVVRTYVFSKYLNDHVSLERGGFEFQKENDAIFGISQSQIERGAAELTRLAIESEVASRQERKAAQVATYVDRDAPWHRALLPKVDLTEFPYNPSNEQIEARLQEEKFREESKIRHDVKRILTDGSYDNFGQTVSEVVERISETSKNDLIHYVALRKNVLDLFQRSLELMASGEYEDEGVIHRIIHPMKEDSDGVGYWDHNLWLLDERLTFTRYLASDLPLNKGRSERPDIIAFNERVAFRADNEASNPVIVFEFKRPQRDDFVNPSSKEDPVEQIIRYVNKIHDGKYQTPTGRNIHVAEHTPFYGYVICDLTEKVRRWLKREKNFKPMPDGLGWFNWYENINLYVEVLSWEKVLKDADMRNKVFFHKLGI